MLKERKRDISAEIMIKALRDEKFRQALKSNPTDTIKKEFKYEFPKELTLMVLEDTVFIKHIVIPSISSDIAIDYSGIYPSNENGQRIHKDIEIDELIDSYLNLCMGP